MPTWTVEQEKALLDMVKENKPLEEIAEAFRRSPDAITMKAKRMGLAIPEKCREKISENKVTKNATTTTPKLKPLKFEELPSPNEAMGLLWAAIRRLQDPDVGKEEAKKLRLIIQGVKSYIHLDADYVFRIREVERRILAMYKTEVVHLQSLADHAKSPEEKARLEAEIKELQGHIADMEAMGITEPKKPRAGADAT